MSKKDEALKLALEALEIGHEYAVETAEHFHIEMAGYKQHRHDAMDAEVKQISDAITAIREALADHTEQPLEMVAEQPAQQPEPHIGWLARNSQGKLDLMTDLQIDSSLEKYERLHKLYTSPQPSKPWVSLTDEEIVRCVVHHRFEYDPPYIDKNGTKHVAHYVIQPGPTYRNIDALLREKNTGETQ